MIQQSNITKHLTDLLFLHDFVIVPDFGAFVTNYKPAEITDNGYITPPSKSISFNSNLKSSDGLLISYLSEKENIDYSNSAQLISEFVRDIFIDLDNKKIVEFENIGSFKFDKELNIIFEPELKLNLLPESFGFTSIHYPQLEKTTKKLERTFSDGRKIRKSLSGSNAKALFFIIPIIIILSIASVKTGVFDKSNYNTSNITDITETGVKDNNKSVIEKQLDSMTKKENALMYIEQTKPTSSGNAFDNKEKNVKIETIEIKKETTPIVKKEPEVIEIPEIIEKEYILVAGSFSSKKNAERFVKKLSKKNINAEIINHKGKYRVSAATFETKAIAKKEVKRLKKLSIKTWISKR